jgi:hypothetical protein
MRSGTLHPPHRTAQRGRLAIACFLAMLAGFARCFCPLASQSARQRMHLACTISQPTSAQQGPLVLCKHGTGRAAAVYLHQPCRALCQPTPGHPCSALFFLQLANAAPTVAGLAAGTDKEAQISDAYGGEGSGESSLTDPIYITAGQVCS